jgi:two-component system sensor histidine kinase/response regulator
MKERNVIKVLIVDDSITVVEFIRKALESNGYIVVGVAYNGEEAIELAISLQPDLIMMDIEMPVMNGLEATRILNELYFIPIILLSSYTGDEMIDLASANGAAGYLLKPSSPSEIDRAIRVAMARSNDLIEVKKLNQKLNELNTKLIVSEENLVIINATKDKFFSIIAHDLRNPLGNFKEVTKLLHESYNEFEEGERLEFIELMKNSSQRIYSLLENLLEWSRTQRGLINFNPIHFDLSEIVKNTFALSVLSANSKKIELINKVDISSEVYGDANLLNTVIRNLVSNSIKFTPENGSIEVNFKSDGKSNLISIKDTGVGMSQETLDKLFRIDSSVSTLGTSQETGTGLGLILCKEFVGMHSGKICVESELGKGSTFYIELPKS